jgi:lysophospholipase L1-like esterase
LCIIVLLYYIYYYSWTHERYFSSPVGPVLYYVLPVTLASLLLASLRLRPPHKVNLALLLVSLCASIYAVELLFVFANDTFLEESTVERVKAAKEFGVNFDTRSRLTVVTDLQKKGIAAVPVILPSILLKQQVNGLLKPAITINSTEVLPLAGIASKVTVFCNESGEYSLYESDEHGFHNPQGIWNVSRIDIAALGDSFTLGACVPSDKNFVALIRKHWPATLNLGSNGIGPLIELAILREYAQFVKPQVVLWFYFEGNDLDDLRREKDSPLLMRYMERNFTQGLFARQPEIDQALTAYVERVKDASRPLSPGRLLSGLTNFIKLSHLRHVLGLDYGRDRASASVVSEAEMELLRTVLLEAKASVSAWGGTLCFVYLPDWPRYAGLTMTNTDRERVLRLVRNIGLLVIDIHLAFQAQSDPRALFPFRLYSHYNEAGHQFVAEEVLRSISPVAEAVRSAGSVSQEKGDPIERPAAKSMDRQHHAAQHHQAHLHPRPKHPGAVARR